MAKKDLVSKIEFSTPTPESFDGKKKQFLLDDEAGHGFRQTQSVTDRWNAIKKSLLESDD